MRSVSWHTRARPFHVQPLHGQPTHMAICGVSAVRRAPTLRLGASVGSGLGHRDLFPLCEPGGQCLQGPQSWLRASPLCTTRTCPGPSWGPQESLGLQQALHFPLAVADADTGAPPGPASSPRHPRGLPGGSSHTLSTPVPEGACGRSRGRETLPSRQRARGPSYVALAVPRVLWTSGFCFPVRKPVVGLRLQQGPLSRHRGGGHRPQTVPVCSCAGLRVLSHTVPQSCHPDGPAAGSDRCPPRLLPLVCVAGARSAQAPVPPPQCSTYLCWAPGRRGHAGL